MKEKEFLQELTCEELCLMRKKHDIDEQIEEKQCKICTDKPYH